MDISMSCCPSNPILKTVIYKNHHQRQVQLQPELELGGWRKVLFREEQMMVD